MKGKKDFFCHNISLQIRITWIKIFLFAQHDLLFWIRTAVSSVSEKWGFWDQRTNSQIPLDRPHHSKYNRYLQEVDTVTHTAIALQELGLTALTTGFFLPLVPPSTTLTQPFAMPHREPKQGTDLVGKIITWKKLHGFPHIFIFQDVIYLRLLLNICLIIAKTFQLMEVWSYYANSCRFLRLSSWWLPQYKINSHTFS